MNKVMFRVYDVNEGYSKENETTIYNGDNADEARKSFDSKSNELFNEAEQGVGVYSYGYNEITNVRWAHLDVDDVRTEVVYYGEKA